MSIFSSVLKYSGFGWVGAQIVALGGWLMRMLVKIPEIPAAPAAPGAAFDATLRQNQLALGNAKPIGYGRWRDWYALCAPAYTSFDARDNQLLHAYLHVTVGRCEIEQLLIGDSPIESFAGYELEVLGPGEAMTLVHPNVYTSADVSDIAVQAGAETQVVITLALEFAGNSIRSSDAAKLYTVPEGTSITISGTASNNVTRTVTNKTWVGGHGTLATYLTVDGATLVSETVTGTITYTQIVSSNIKTIETAARDSDNNLVSLSFSDSLSAITGPDGWLADFRLGDTLRPVGSALNDDTTFTVLQTDGSDELVVTPAPAAESADCILRLMTRRHGPFVACPSGAKVDAVELDITFAMLAKQSGSDLSEATVSFEARVRAIDDAGTPSGAWASTIFSVTGSKNSPRRYTQRIELGTPARVQVDLRRMSVDNGASDVYDDAIWSGLRGFIVPRAGETPALDDECTRIALILRSSGQLSAVSNPRINGTQTRILPVWTGSAWIEQQTRNPAWAAVDWLLRGSGGAITHADFDTASLLAFADACDADAVEPCESNGLVGAERPLWDGAQALLRTGRGTLYLRPEDGLLAVRRDELQTPTLLFGDGINASVGVDKLAMRAADTPRGVLVKFTDPTLWQEREGPTVGTDEDVREASLEFCSSWQKAYQEAQYQYNLMRYRTHSVSFDAEMEGLLATMGERALLASAAKNWGQAVELSSVDGDTLTTNPAPIWASAVRGDGVVIHAQHYVYVQDNSGAPSARIDVTRGATDAEIVLGDSLSFTPRTDGIRTVIAFGNDARAGSWTLTRLTCIGKCNAPLSVVDAPSVVDAIAESAPRRVILSDGSGNGRLNISFTALLDDDRVYELDGVAPADNYGASIAAPTLTLPDLQWSWDETGAWYAQWKPLDASLFGALVDVAWRDASDVEWQTLRRGVSQTRDHQDGAYMRRVAGSWDTGAPFTLQVRVRTLMAGYVSAAETIEMPLGSEEGDLLVYVSNDIAGTQSSAADFSRSIGVETHGGSGSKIYAWARIDGSTGISIADAAAATGVFSVTGMASSETRSARWRCTVTDASGSAQSVPVELTFTRT